MIYAIEEPETSQHPNYQRIIIESLKKISTEQRVSNIAYNTYS